MERSKNKSYRFFLQRLCRRFLFVAGTLAFAQIGAEITLPGAVLRKVVDHRELYNGGENEREREEDEEV